MEDYVFVYGSLMRGFEAHEGLALSERSDFLGEAKVSGSLYAFDDYPGLVRTETGVVEGELYLATDPGLIDDLDRYENYYPDAVEESMFVRSYVDVVDRSLQAWAYVYNDDVSEGEGIESGSWRKYVEETGDVQEETEKGSTDDFAR